MFSCFLNALVSCYQSLPFYFTDEYSCSVSLSWTRFLNDNNNNVDSYLFSINMITNIIICDKITLLKGVLYFQYENEHKG